MEKRLFVGNLPFSPTETELNEMFAQSGTVESVRLITDRSSGQSKGFGYVEMATEADAENAIRSWSGTRLEGRSIMVTEAKPQEPRQSGFAGRKNHHRFDGQNRHRG